MVTSYTLIINSKQADDVTQQCYVQEKSQRLDEGPCQQRKKWDSPLEGIWRKEEKKDNKK